ncbi:FG-GAP repeat protein [Bdellovibrio sp. NC01]|uniref:FG-GAP repeat protein n=1 Tax=Bdellovibrio sp. NC01 TaxID=2220073 RepID=UPI00115A56E4|nr:FG-GAP repeat protein [Bdellovibrio sp. NC01]
MIPPHYWIWFLIPTAILIFLFTFKYFFKPKPILITGGVLIISIFIAAVSTVMSYELREIPMYYQPKSWKKVANFGLFNADNKWRYDDKNGPYINVSGDFNGDGITDLAEITANREMTEIAVYVFWNCNRNSTPTLAIHDELPAAEMGIELYKPGTYQTACGKGYFECTDGDTPTVTFKYDAINLFKYESANSSLYWNPKTQKFDQHYMSD